MDGMGWDGMDRDNDHDVVYYMMSGLCIQCLCKHPCTCTYMCNMYLICLCVG